MRAPSRKIAPPPPPCGDYPFLWLVVLAGVFFCTLAIPISLLGSVGVFAGLLLIGWLLGLGEEMRLRKLARNRSQDAICGFARSFDFRRTDTWILRATFETLQGYTPKGPSSFPIIATDRLVKDLHIDDLDFDFIVEEIAQRAGYSTDELEQNPPTEPVVTVGDLVAVIARLPRKPERSK